MVNIELAKDVYWVGVIDWDIRDFHGYSTRRGTTYNAYLIVDEKVALIDTVKSNFSDEFLRNINEIINPSDIDYIIINHLEKDHSGSLPSIAEKAKNAKIIASKRCGEDIPKYYSGLSNVETVKTGDQLRLGRKTLQFIEAPMLHWPDSMFTYIVENAILMPNDAFGQHLATSERFDDEVDEATLMEEAAKYYANILMPLSPLIARKIQELIAMKIPIKMIAPSHGVIWRSDPMKIVNAYMRWSEGKTVDKAVIVYDSMWGSTAAMARAIAEGMTSRGISVKFFKLRDSDLTDIVAEILEAKAVVVGSPTLNNAIFPSVAAFLNYIINLKPRGKLWAFFSSYGWGGGAVKQMIEAAGKAGFTIYNQSIEAQYAPTKEKIAECFNFGVAIAERIKSS